MGKRFFEPRKTALNALLGCIFLTHFGFSQGFDATANEALMLRRITEYWKDGDYAIVKRQIINFLEQNPNTNLHDHLNAMLGDLYFQERNFRQALATYDLIGSNEIRAKTFFNHLQAHFEMRDFLSVIEKGEAFVHNHKKDPLEFKVRYLIAEGAFRQALKSSDPEEKNYYLKLAKPHYKLLAETKYSDRSLFPLAEIHRLLREDQRAAGLYLQLAEKHPQHRERFLFQAAVLQINENKNEAIRTFQMVSEMGGKRARLASYNQLILLYQNDDYQSFLDLYQSVIETMPEQKVPLLQFYEGRCHYAMQNFDRAIEPLEKFVTSGKGTLKEAKTAHLLLVNTSRHLNDLPLLERTLSSFRQTFPKDSDIAKVLMIHAQMCRESGDTTKALNDLKILASQYPEYEDTQAVMYDRALLLCQAERWLESREVFLAFLEKYPHSKKKTAAWRHLINCCIEELQSPEQINSNASKEMFITILQRVFQEDGILTPKEHEQYSLVMMKCQCELGLYEEVIPVLSTFISDALDKDCLAEAHLLMAICHQKTGPHLRPFIQHAEKALSYNPNLQEKGLLHLELFNAYLSIGLTETKDQTAQDLTHSAAEHLFASNSWKNQSIKLDNFLWLANHYYKKAAKRDQNAFKKANILFRELLGVEDEIGPLKISQDSLYLEGEVLKYSHILELNGKKEDKIKILEMLVHKQEEQSQLPWKLQKRAIFELARAYESADQYQNALNSYRNLTNSLDKTPSILQNSAKLHLAKLEYKLLKGEKRNSESPEMVSILHTLKDLQIQKKVAAEPVHLEAALQYAEIRSQLSNPDEYAKNVEFFYNRVYEDFHNQDDPITQEYTIIRSQNPEKDAVFIAYMDYIDAQIKKYQAEVAREEGNLEIAQGLEQTALENLEELLGREETLYPYLFDRVKRAKAEIAKKLCM